MKRVLAFAILFVLCALALGQPIECSESVSAAPMTVKFDIFESAISGTFRTKGDVGNDVTIKPGDQLQLTVSAQQSSGTLTLDLGAFGKHSVDFDTPLGTVSIPIAGVPGVMTANMDITGSLTGTLSAGDGSLDKTDLRWTSWGTKGITFDSTGVLDGTDVTIRLRLYYTFSLGVSVGILILGNQQLLSEDVSDVQGSPTLSMKIRVRSAPEASFTSEMLPILLGVVIIIIAIVAVVVLWKKQAPPSEPEEGTGETAEVETPLTDKPEKTQ